MQRLDVEVRGTFDDNAFKRGRLAGQYGLLYIVHAFVRTLSSIISRHKHLSRIRDHRSTRPKPKFPKTWTNVCMSSSAQANGDGFTPAECFQL